MSDVYLIAEAQEDGALSKKNLRLELSGRST